MSRPMRRPSRPLSHARERHALTILTMVFFLLVGGPAGLNPDGLEMIALGRGWIGLGPELPAGGYWPPLWPALVTLMSPLLPGITAGRLLNLLLAGLIVAPLHRLTTRLAGVHGARLAVGLYVGLPAVREHAVVLDARVLGSFLAISTLAWAVEAHTREAEADPSGDARRAWALAGLSAGLAALTRPEGMAFPLLLALGSLLSGPALTTSTISELLRRLPRGIALLAAVLPAVLRPGAEVRAWESFTGPWLGLWPSRDLVALFGANSAPTAYRDFVVAAGAAGLGRPGLSLSNLLQEAPAGLRMLGTGLPASTGALALVLAAAGALVILTRPRWGPRILLPAMLGLVVPLVLLPQARDQPTAATNLIYFVPALCALVAVAVLPPGKPHPLALVLVLACLGEAHLGPYRAAAPSFSKGTDIAETMRRWLDAHPPASGLVAATLSTRGIVFRAGLAPTPLPSGWEWWEAPEGAGVLLSSMDLRGADGGRGRMLLENPRWKVSFVCFEDEAAAWELWLQASQQGRLPPELPRHAHWLLYLERR